MTKDIITAVFIFFFVKASWIVDKLGYGEIEQVFAYNMGFVLTFLALMIFIVTEIKGDRVYLWLFGVVAASMNPINLIFLDLKLTMVHALVCYVISAWVVFLYRKYK